MYLRGEHEQSYQCKPETNIFLTSSLQYQIRIQYNGREVIFAIAPSNHCVWMKVMLDCESFHVSTLHMYMWIMHYSTLMSSVVLSSSCPQFLHLTCGIGKGCGIQDVVQCRIGKHSLCRSSCECSSTVYMAAAQGHVAFRGFRHQSSFNMLSPIYLSPYRKK